MPEFGLEPEGLLDFQFDNSVIMSMSPLAGLENGIFTSLWENSIDEHLVEYYTTDAGSNQGYYDFNVYTKTQGVNANVDLDHFAVEYEQSFTFRALLKPDILTIMKAPFESERDITKFMARLGETYALKTVAFVGSTEEYIDFYNIGQQPSNSANHLGLILGIVIPISLIILAAVCFFLRREEKCSISFFSRGRAKDDSSKNNTMSGNTKNRALDLDPDVLDIELDNWQTKHQQYSGCDGRLYGHQGSQPHGYPGAYAYPQNIGQPNMVIHYHIAVAAGMEVGMMNQSAILGNVFAPPQPPPMDASRQLPVAAPVASRSMANMSQNIDA